MPSGEEKRENIFVNPGKPIPPLVQQLTGIKVVGQLSLGLRLAAAYKFYCGRKMEDDFEAHRADQDTEATYRVLMGELDKYSAENQTEPERQLANDMDVLAEFSKNNDNVDFAGRIVWKEVTGPDGKPVMGADGKPMRQEVFNFGKHKGLPVADVLKRDPGYFSWMLGGDFTYNTKQVLTRIRLREFNNRNGLK